jgi:hypothetical protein
MFCRSWLNGVLIATVFWPTLVCKGEEGKELLRKFLNTVFVGGINCLMTMGTIIVWCRCPALRLPTARFAVKIMKTVGKPAFIIAALTGLVGFVQGYVNGWDMGD